MSTTPGKGPTPGPWRADPTDARGWRTIRRVTNPGAVPIAEVMDFDRDGANAELIAAAPETAAERNRLREALRGLLHHNAGEITCECCEADTHDCVFCRARAALGLP